MTPSHHFDADVIIVGGGPAGLSTALHLVQNDARWAQRILVLEKEAYPRPKLCGGGITRPGLNILSGLGIKLDTPRVRVKELQFRYHDQLYLVRDDPVIEVVNRSEFDHSLARQARARGVHIIEGAGVSHVAIDDDGVQVRAGARTLRARALVAADGSNSQVRRLLDWGRGHKARLLEVLTPADASSEAFERGVALFDWSVLDQNVQGYYWDFPSIVSGRATMNRGIFDANLPSSLPKAHLPDILAAQLAERDLDLADYQLKGFPIHWWSPDNELARPRVLLAGDAAGSDPMLGEGIAFALGYGQIAARALDHAFHAHDFSFGDYAQQVESHWLTRQLRGRHLGARLIMASMRWPPLTRAPWAAAPWLFQALAIFRPDYIPLSKKQLFRKRLKKFMRRK